MIQMKTKILVAYATSYGSTQEIAEVVAETLRNSGLAVDLYPMRDVKKLDEYSAVVLGSCLYMFHWHKDTNQFLSRHQKALMGGLPVAFFVGGPSGAGDEKEWQEVRSQVEKDREKVPWFRPVSVEIVGGRFDPAKLRLPYSLIPALRKLPVTDLRDWAAIRAWATSLVGLFHFANQVEQPILTK